MANATYPSQDQGQPNPAAYANIVGAVISLAVLVGIIGWGAKTLIRDSSGVPVVAALDGPMRVAPADPGGIPASHQGLTVNQVAGSQPLADLSENLQLAPRPVNLLDEDVPMGAARPTMRVDDTGLNVEMASVTVEDIPVQGSQTVEDLAAMIAAAATPLTDLPVTDVVAPAVQTELVAVAAQPSGLARSLRPITRPNFQVAAVVSPAAVNITPVASAIPAGTRMAQLGAYDSLAIAEAEWARLSGVFSGYLNGKPHVIQSASSGGTTFFRLRVHGFADASEARSLCSVLISKNAACYPVTMN